MPTHSDAELPSHCTTIEAAKRLGLAVRSVQLMVDRGELEGWKTAGGHRRILLESVQRWIDERRPAARRAPSPASPRSGDAANAARSQAHLHAATVLIIEDSVHYQKLLSLLIEQHFPEIDLQVANDGVSGLAMCGSLRPDLLIVDILLPGIDGAALISTLRSHAQFAATQLIVVTSLDESQREPYAFALKGVPVVHKTRIVQDLPALLQSSLAPKQRPGQRVARAVG